MDSAEFEKVATPIILDAMEQAKEIANSYYSNSYLEALAPSPERVEQYKTSAKERIHILNEEMERLNPLGSGLISVEQPCPFEPRSEVYEDFIKVETEKNMLVDDLCLAYGIAPPPPHIIDIGLIDRQSVIDLIIHLASETLKTPLKPLPVGRQKKPEEEKQLDDSKTEVLVTSIDAIKSETKARLKARLSDEKVIKLIFSHAEQSTPFGKKCMHYKRFFIGIKGPAYNPTSIKNKISAARRSLKNKK